LRKRGLSGLRTLEVAALAGVSQGAQFHYFPTKRDLIVATIEDINQKMLETSRTRAERGGGGGDAISQVIADASEYFFSDYFFIELAIGIGGDEDPELQETVRAMTRDFRVSVEQAWATSLTERGLPQPLAADILALTLSLVRGFAVRLLIEPDRKRITRLFKVWRDIVENYIAKGARQPSGPTS